jgi:RHS repeat-associated protein
MQMPGRQNYYGAGVSYRYAYNGMELDNEVSGNGNSYTTEFRQYDPRLGRWKSLDPLMAQFPWMSPYVAFDNNPVFYVDPLGLASEGGPDGEPADTPCEGEPDKRAGGDDGNGGFNGHQEVGEVGITVNRNTGKIESIAPPTKDNGAKYSVDIMIGEKTIDTKFFERSFDARNFISDFNKEQREMAARHFRIKESERAALYDRVEKGKNLKYAAAMVGIVAAPIVLPWVIEGGILASAYASDAALWGYMSAEATCVNTVTALSKFTAGRVVIWTTAIMFETTLPAANSGKPSTTTATQSGYFSNMGRNPALTGFSKGGNISNVGGQLTKGIFGKTTYFQSQVGTASMIVDNGVYSRLEPWPANIMNFKPFYRGTILGGGSYLFYKVSEYNQNNK